MIEFYLSHLVTKKVFILVKFKVHKSTNVMLKFKIIDEEINILCIHIYINFANEKNSSVLCITFPSSHKVVLFNQKLIGSFSYSQNVQGNK